MHSSFDSWLHAVCKPLVFTVYRLHAWKDCFLAQMRGPGGDEWRQHVSECAAETGLSGKQVGTD
jgi:hypothetical protein